MTQFKKKTGKKIYKEDTPKIRKMLNSTSHENVIHAS